MSILQAGKKKVHFPFSSGSTTADSKVLLLQIAWSRKIQSNHSSVARKTDIVILIPQAFTGTPK